MPTLDWIGKNKIINHHSEVPFRILEKQYTYKDGEIDNTFESENKIIHGDNLEALKALLPEYEGKVKCIYIDPPYNTGNEGWVYNDNVNDPRIKEWLGNVVGNETDDLTRHDKWLCMMYPRLKLLHRLLSDDGAIFISIDDNEQSNLKLMCDEMFGLQNFVANIPWRKRTAKSDVPFGISQDYESILCYAKSNLFRGSIKGKERKYFETEDYPGKAWRFHDLTKQTTIKERPNSNFTITNPKNGDEYPVNPLRSWAITKDTFKQYYDEGRIIFPGDYDFLNISKPVLRYWKEDDVKKAGEDYGLTAASSFLPPAVGMTQDGTKEITEIFGAKEFNFPKPSSLIEYLLKISVGTKPDSIILDSFAGSGTTAQAVLNMNKADGGNRKFILVELCDYADTITAERVKRVIRGYKSESEKEDVLYDKELTVKNLPNVSEYLNEAKEIAEGCKDTFDSVKTKLENNHLQVIGKTKASNDIIGTGGDFSFYELGKSLFKDNFLNDEVDISYIRSYIWFTETHTSLPQEVKNDNGYFLGKYNNAGYWFFYDKDKETCLDLNFMQTLRTKSEQYIIYADKCCLPDSFMKEYNIVFKKIPREIQKF